MHKITEIIPDSIPDWAKDAMDDGQFFRIALERIALLESQLKDRDWVSVEDRLPDNRSDVLAYWRPIDHKDRPFHREIIIASLSFCEDGKYSDKWWANGRYYEGDFITHWMPLPSPPLTDTPKAGE